MVFISISNGKCLSIITGIDKHQKLGMIQMYQIYTGIVKCYDVNMASTAVTYTLSGLPPRKARLCLGLEWRLSIDRHYSTTYLTLMIGHGVWKSCSFTRPSAMEKWCAESHFVHCIIQYSILIIGMLCNITVCAPLFQRYHQTQVLCPKTSQTLHK